MTTVGPNDNVFAALDLPDADEWLAKAELARAIQRLIEARDLTQMEAAARSGVRSPTFRILPVAGSPGTRWNGCTDF